MSAREHTLSKQVHNRPRLTRASEKQCPMTRLKIGVVCVAATVLLVFSGFAAVAAPANAANDSQQTGAREC